MKQQLPSCALLQADSRGLGCFGGVNFFAVGADRALCRDCELLAMDGFDALLSCEHSDVYTHLTYEEHHPIVRPILECALSTGAPTEQRCAACPTFVSAMRERDTTA